MKKVKFRIIELPTHQVLLTKDFDEEEKSTELLVVTFFLEGVKVNLKFGYDKKERRDKHFSGFTDKKAQDIIDNVKSQFE